MLNLFAMIFDRLPIAWHLLAKFVEPSSIDKDLYIKVCSI